MVHLRAAGLPMGGAKEEVRVVLGPESPGFDSLRFRKAGVAIDTR
jgi:hypothetical protein